MRLKPLVILLLVMQALLVTFQAHALTTGKLDVFPEGFKNLKNLLIELRNFATFDPNIFLKNQHEHADLPPELQAELASVSYSYNARAITGVKGKFKEMSVLFQNPFAANTSHEVQNDPRLQGADSKLEQARLQQARFEPLPSLAGLRKIRQQARDSIPKHLRGLAEHPEYDIAYNKVTTPRRTGNKNTER
jgi:hypothetical protein